MAQQTKKSKQAAAATTAQRSISTVAPMRAIVLLLLLLCSCADSRYVDVYAFAGNEWASERSVVFTYRVSDTITPASVDISIRYNNDMKLMVLPLEIKSHHGASPQYWVDTMYVVLRESMDSKPLGTQYTNHTELTLPYRTAIRYPHSGIRTISIRQLSDSTTLTGLMSVGVVATPAEQQ